MSNLGRRIIDLSPRFVQLPVYSLVRGIRGARRGLLRQLPRPILQIDPFLAQTPISRRFGQDRGQPVDRFYIERFLEQHQGHIRGRVLEIAGGEYTRRYGGDKVTRADVLHASPGNPQATIVGDLTRADNVPSDTFDCIILTQTLHCIFDIKAVVLELSRMLKPGGAVLATLPGISQISRYDMNRWGEYWRFTDASARLLFETAFPPEGIEVEVFGNILTAVALLHGLAAHEIPGSAFTEDDPDYQVIITVCAAKPLG